MRNTTLLGRMLILLFVALLCGGNLCQAQIPRALLTAIPQVPEDNDQPLTIIYDASQGNGTLNLHDGKMYAHTGVITSTSAGDSDWKYLKSDESCLMTKLGDNKWKFTMPQGIRKFYSVPSDESIYKVAIIFRSEDSNLWGKGAIGDGNLFLNVGSLIQATPANPTLDEPVVITFHAGHSTQQAVKHLKGYTGDLYAHTGVITSASGSLNDWKHSTSWGDNSAPYKLTSLGHDGWQLVMPQGIRSYYGIGMDEEVTKLAFVFRGSDNKQSENIYVDLPLEIAKPSASFPDDVSEFSIVFNTAAGNQKLKDLAGPLYVHTGVTIDGKDWQNSSTWKDNAEKYQLTSLGSNKWKLTLTGGIRSFYGKEGVAIPEVQTVSRISFVLRNADGTIEAKQVDGSDIFVEISPKDLAVRFDSPKRTKSVKQNEEFSYLIAASTSAELNLYKEGTSLKSATGTKLSGTYSFDQPGEYILLATATVGDKTVQEELKVTVQASTLQEALPAGMRPGINYDSVDPTKVTLVLQAPYKESAYVIGDFNDWTYNDHYQMKHAGEMFWITLTGLTSGEEYAYQYVVDQTITIADPYTEKVLDPWNDNELIAKGIYPDLKLYPSKASGIVSVFQTGQEDYSWQVKDFKRPDKQDLVVYEIHLRDFTTEGTFKGALAKVSYLKELGINAVELMPTNEFEGNDSWGYNPSFYFAPDKAYGTAEDMKHFIDQCHANGIAVIIDMVLNHSFGQSPLLHLYKDASGNPLMINPWYNVKSNIENQGLQWGCDFNHESFYTRDFVDRVNIHWLTEYRVDGIRYDFTKGFSNTTYYQSSDEYANAYDGGRIYNLTRMKSVIDKTSPGAYLICEHLTSQPEEKQLGEAGLMMWRNMNPAYMTAGMGKQTDGTHGSSDFNRLYEWGASDMPSNSLVGYMESHDEERVAHVSYNYGVIGIGQSLPYSMKQLATCTAFFLTVPGPKMIWQFGELGYDISINEGGRTGKKPLHWEYYDVDERKYLFDVYSKILYLRQQHPEIFWARGNFGDSQYGFKWNVGEGNWEGGRMIHSQAKDKSMVVVGNFSGVDGDCYAEFTNTGTWYDYMNGGTIEVTSNNQTVRVPAHEFRLYLNFKPQQRVIHSSDVAPALAAEESLLLRSGGWKSDKIKAFSQALKGGSDTNETLKTIDLTQVAISEEVTGMLDGCASLTTLKAPNLNYTGTLLSGANPNCLIYLPQGSDEAALSGWKNVVGGAEALTDITIDDAHPFKIAQPFTVSGKVVSYTRNFVGAGKTGGWETLCLPFAPSNIKSDEATSMKPVTSTTAGDFWLKAYTGSTAEGVVNFASAASIDACTPYLIAFPGKAWGQSNPEQWKVTFTATAAEFDAAKEITVTSDNYHFKGNFEPITKEVASRGYLLNTTDNKFVKAGATTLTPFRAYFADATSVASAAKSLSIGEGQTTGVEDTTPGTADALTAYGGKGEVVVTTTTPVDVVLFDLDGRLVYKRNNVEGTLRISLPQGMYVVNKKKIIVY